MPGPILRGVYAERSEWAQDDTPTMIHLLFTGGTISMRRDPAAGGNVPALGGEALGGVPPGFQAIAPYRIENWVRGPASHFGPARLWEPPVAGRASAWSDH